MRSWYQLRVRAEQIGVMTRMQAVTVDTTSASHSVSLQESERLTEDASSTAEVVVQRIREPAADETATDVGASVDETDEPETNCHYEVVNPKYRGHTSHRE
jgi:hypothetical protein